MIRDAFNEATIVSWDELGIVKMNLKTEQKNMIATLNERPKKVYVSLFSNGVWGYKIIPRYTAHTHQTCFKVQQGN